MMNEEQLKSCAAVDKALARAKKAGLMLYAYTDSGLYLAKAAPSMLLAWMNGAKIKISAIILKLEFFLMPVLAYDQ